MGRMLLLAMSLMAADGGGLRVTVSDSTGAAVIRSEVTLACSGSTPRVVRVDDTGSVAFANLRIGDCQVAASSAGFKTWRGVYAVKGTEEGKLEARLEIGALANEVEVRPKSAGRRFVDWLSSCARR